METADIMSRKVGSAQPDLPQAVTACLQCLLLLPLPLSESSHVLGVQEMIQLSLGLLAGVQWGQRKVPAVERRLVYAVRL